ncbi:AAA family ATPase [Microcoleus sp. MON1_C5]|uniref:AAA family ATPase n=1 Tax=Microcoleus sp. MON1_C5 TaxID=2818828 RepID=UPI002FD357CD
MLSIAGVATQTLLYESANSLVYRAIREADNQRLILKLLKETYPTPQELVRYRTEYRITRELKEPGVVQVYDLRKYQNSLVMFVEDFGGESLKIWMQQRKFTLEEFLQIAIATTEILGQIHRANIIHKDINPSNIVYNPQTKQLKIIDFGISTQLTRETPLLKNPNVLEGTLAYISPEQTGRMNRALDYRTDFYSLGVTFYELLSGKLPFETEDALELVHCHIAREPVPLQEIEPTIPLILSLLVSKLMAKNAENRYQTAGGLKHDLESCLVQLQETDSIAEFDLGTRDITDRFLIPEKLYGRESEVDNLLAAFERVSTGNAEMMLVAGLSGIGKTAVVNEVHKPIARQRGYFIKGKYDQFGRNIPFSAFVQAFRELMGQLLSETDAQLHTWKTKILTAVGEIGQVLIEVIPELERIIGAQGPALELSGSAAQNRFNLLMQKFVQVFTTAQHPLVMFLDDLQWADSASLKLLQLLMEDTGHLLVVGAYRDNEVSQSHPFMLTLDEIIKSGAVVNTITLQPLSLADMNQLVADTLICDLSLAGPLTELVAQKTKGNPFFSTQFLKSLYEDGQIIFNYPQSPLIKGGPKGGWQYDIAQARLTHALDVVEFMAVQLQKLPAQTQDVIKLAACIGAQFDLETLAIVSDELPEPTASALWRALQEGLILPITEGYKCFIQTDGQSNTQPVANPIYQFLHDRVQQAAYSLIPEDQKQSVHLHIGQLLLARTSAEQLDERIFAIVSQFNLGIDRIAIQARRDHLANLNLMAARKARLSAAYPASAQYCEIGLRLLATDSSDQWIRQPILTSELHIEGANSACLIGAFERVDACVEAVLQHRSNPLEQVKVLEIKIQSLMARNQLSEAIQVARAILQELDVDLPEHPTQEMVAPALNAIGDRLMSVDVMNSPKMSDPQKLAAMNILSSMASAAYIGSPALYPLIVLKQIELSLQFGNAIQTPYAYSTYGLILCAFGGEIVAGNRAADIAIALMEMFKASSFKAKIFNLVYPFVRIWQEPMHTVLMPLLEGYQAGLETGDLEFAAYCAYNRCQLAYAAGNELLQLGQEMQTYAEAIAQVKQTTALNFHQIVQQAVLNWTGEADAPQKLVGEAYDETTRLPQHKLAGDTYSLGSVYAHKLILAYHFGQPQEALEIAQIGEKTIGAIIGTLFYGVFYFYHALTLLANTNTLPISEAVTKDLEQLTKWATHAPMNFAHKGDLIRAEQQRILGNKAEASDLYDRAISGAKENKFINEEALANELAAKFYLEWGKEKVAKTYMIEAYYCYAQWGATAKVKDLETRYSQLLTAIKPGRKNHKTTASLTTNGSGINLDITTVMKASQAISGEILLEKLMSSLIKIVMENAGAQKGYLILSSQGKLLIEAEGTINSEQVTVLQSISVESCQELSSAIVNYVARTQESVVLDDAAREGQFTNDPYIQKHQPKSILCVPLIYQSQIVSIVYVENNLTAGAFTPERVELLKVLSGQAAISIQNSKLYTEVRENERKLTQFLEAIPVGIGIVDASGKPYYTNRVAQDLLGKGVIADSRSEQIAEVYQNYKAGTDEEYPAADLPIVRALNGESTTADDIEIHQGDKIIPIEGWGTPIYDEKGHIAYAIVAFQDITERKKAETERIRFTNELFQLNKAYERFVPNQFLQFLEKSSIIDVELGDQVQLEMSVLFSDIRDFTTLSESMTPEDNFRFINSYLSRMEPVINGNNGFIDKYIGDAIMALFSGEADNAVKAGIAMLQSLVEYNQQRANFGCAPIQIGIGINTGTLMLGTVGGQNRMEGTVISDAVNLASRVESLTKNYGVSLLITQSTYSRLENLSQYAIRTLDTVKVKGKSELVTVYEVFDAEPPEIKAGKLATLELFAEALEIYSEGKLAEAARLFAECWGQNQGDRVAKIYWERCQSTLRNRTKIKDRPHDLD